MKTIFEDRSSSGQRSSHRSGHTSDKGSGSPSRRIFGWTGLIGLALLASTLVGWFFLRDLPQAVLGFLLAAGAGGMFYLTITDLVPQAEERQYQQAGAVAAAAGFLIILLLAEAV